MLQEKNQTRESSELSQVPPGTIMPWAGGAASYGQSPPPAGWLYCDGSAVSREIYGALFAAIGTYFGSGDGSTTFNLPGFAGAFARNISGGAGAQNTESTFAANHQHEFNSSVSIQSGNNGNTAGSHNHNNVACSTNGHSFGHGGSWGLGNTATAGRTVGNANFGRSDHNHNANFGIAFTHNGNAHNVVANTASANHSHTAPTISNNSETSTASGAWSPLYIDMWHLIKA